VSGSFDAAADQYVSLSAGGVGAMGTGAFTIAALFKTPTLFAGSIRTAIGLYASGALSREIIDVDGALFGFGDFSAGYGVFARDAWYVAALSKPAGAAHYRGHIWAYDSGGAGAMSHGEAAGAANHGDGSAITEIRVGLADVRTNGLIAVVGLWASALSDAQLDTLVTTALSDWAALGPDALLSLETWNGATGCTDVLGTAAQTGLTGTVGAGANPPGFDFALSRANGLAGAVSGHDSHLRGAVDVASAVDLIGSVA